MASLDVQVSAEQEKAALYVVKLLQPGPFHIMTVKGTADDGEDEDDDEDEEE